MDKQAKIEKAIKTCIAIEQSCGEFDGNRLTKQILRVENELGVVIKVDRELPENDWEHSVASAVYHEAQWDMLKAGYVAVEPLISK